MESPRRRDLSVESFRSDVSVDEETQKSFRRTIARWSIWIWAVVYFVDSICRQRVDAFHTHQYIIKTMVLLSMLVSFASLLLAQSGSWARHSKYLGAYFLSCGAFEYIRFCTVCVYHAVFFTAYWCRYYAVFRVPLMISLWCFVAPKLFCIWLSVSRWFWYYILDIDIHPLAMFGMRPPPAWGLRMPPSMFWLTRIISWVFGLKMEYISTGNVYDLSGTEDEWSHLSDSQRNSESDSAPSSPEHQQQALPAHLPEPSPASSSQRTPLLTSSASAATLKPVRRVRSRNGLTSNLATCSNVSVAATGSTRGLETDYDWTETESDWTQSEDITPVSRRAFEINSQGVLPAQTLSAIDEGSREGSSARGLTSDARSSDTQSDSPEDTQSNFQTGSSNEEQVKSSSDFTSLDDESDAIQSDGFIVLNEPRF